MNKIIYIAVVLLIVPIFQVNALSSANGQIKKLNWDGIDVVWLKEEKLPSYDVVFYFAEGALGDRKGKSGETFLALGLMDSGTRRYKRTEIADNLEYFGASYGHNVFHEYSTYRVSGLTKDIVPTMMKVCHLFKEATYPKNELRKDKRRLTTSLKQLIENQSRLADRAFRNLSIGRTGFERPVEGKLRDLRRIKRADLLKRLKFLTDKTYKKIYINGPESVLEKLKYIVRDNCGFKAKNANFKRVAKYKDKKLKTPKIALITVPKTNKVEVRIGRFINEGELKESELSDFASGYLGGGFTAILMEVLRKQKGLVYSVYAYSSFQKYYGRSAISTSTKKDKLEELLDSTKSVIEDASAGKIESKDFNRIQNYIVGSYPFQFEKGSSFLNKLIYFDHLGHSYNKINQFKGIVSSFGINDLKRKISEIFDWNKQYIVVLGDKSLKKILKKYGKVEVFKWRKFL